MRQVVPIQLPDVTPTPHQVLAEQGINNLSAASERVQGIAATAVELYAELGRPASVLMDISRDDFVSVYRGQGLNEEATPLQLIYPKAGSLALFAMTLGPDVSEKISQLFDAQDFALGAMLDAAASWGADQISRRLVDVYRQQLADDGRLAATQGVMPFSPGYCGWHLSAQRELFAVLHPEEIGITLTDSFLMEPLKSISGVMIAAARQAFVFADDFPFCADCRTRSCRERIAEVLEG
jgi:hypothetical protein